MAIPWLADVLRGAGLTVIEDPGWQNRGVKGSFNPIGVLWHHTASVSSPQRPAPSLNVVRNGRPDLQGPLCHALVDYFGRFHIIAAGRANHAGRSKGSGPIPAGDGNTMLIGWEIDYQGVNQGITPEQYAASVKATRAVLDRLGRPSEFARGHRETSTTGKIDPGFVDLNRMRADVAAAGRPVPTNAYRPGAVMFQGRPLVFGVSPAGRVYYREGRAGGAGWVDLAGSVVGPPSVTVSPDGNTVSVLVCGTDSALYENRMTSGSKFTGWTKIGGQVKTPPTTVWSGGQLMALAVDAQNVPGLFARAEAGSWSGWVSQGGYLKGQQAAIASDSGTVHAFGRGGDDRLYQNTYAGGTWSGWVDRGGALTGDPAAIRGGSQVRVFAAGGGNRLYSNSAPEARTGTGTWSGWEDLGGSVGAHPTAITDAEGRWIHAYVRGTDSKPYQQRKADGAWSGWGLLPGSINGGITALPAGDSITLYAIGTDQKLYTATTQAGSAPTGWTDLGGLLRT